MSVNLKVEPFDVEFLPNFDKGIWEEAGGELSLSFFGTEIWTLSVNDGYVDEIDRDKVMDVAVEVLGELIAERLNARITAGEYGGVKID